MGNIGIWQLLIVAVIIILLFGTKKLRNLGSDLGSSVKGFKKAMGAEEAEDTNKSINEKEKDELIATKQQVENKDKEQA